MYQEYYAEQLYQNGYVRLNDKKNASKIPTLLKKANAYRKEHGLPHDLSAENVSLRPVHRMSVQDLLNAVYNCIRHKIVSDECDLDEKIHPTDKKWITTYVSKKLNTKKSLIRAYINIVKHKTRRSKKEQQTRRTRSNRSNSEEKQSELTDSPT